jgi:signal transduction histidine kinase
LHVANRIYDSEEYYFQSMLNKSDATEIPFEPTFSMFSALKKALLPIVDDPMELRLIDTPSCPLNYRDERFHMLVTADSDMLGNRNHMVLLLENLLNNAVYYADQKATKNRYSRVAILLSKKQGQIKIEVYNRGPQIKDEDRSKIFQLGYSSRRIRDHHGKGLGLYFVNEICKGFEGSVDFENIENQENALSLRIELYSGEVETHFIAMSEDNGKPLCRIAKTDTAAGKTLEWSFSSLISRVEVSSGASTEPQVITELDEQQDVSQLDSSEVLIPRWVLEIGNRKKSAKLVFRALDVRGVRFEVKLPTALSRLENQDAELDA